LSRIRDNEGARLLRGLLDGEHRAKDVAIAIGISRRGVDYLALGARIPSLPVAHAFHQRYGIPFAAWLRAPEPSPLIGLGTTVPGARAIPPSAAADDDAA
jgi:transcriptional regulator with XRE-family HTH domain